MLLAHRFGDVGARAEELAVLGMAVDVFERAFPVHGWPARAVYFLASRFPLPAPDPEYQELSLRLFRLIARYPDRYSSSS
jgi:hypothetical protein